MSTVSFLVGATLPTRGSLRTCCFEEKPPPLLILCMIAAYHFFHIYITSLLWWLYDMIHFCVVALRCQTQATWHVSHQVERVWLTESMDLLARKSVVATSSSFVLCMIIAYCFDWCCHEKKRHDFNWLVALLRQRIAQQCYCYILQCKRQVLTGLTDESLRRVEVLISFFFSLTFSPKTAIRAPKIPLVGSTTSTRL